MEGFQWPRFVLTRPFGGIMYDNAHNCAITFDSATVNVTDIILRYHYKCIKIIV